MILIMVVMIGLVIMHVVAMIVLMVTVVMSMIAVVVPMLPLTFLQMHIKVKRIQPALLRPPKMQMIASNAQTPQCTLQLCAVGAQIQERAHGHIAADSRVTFQI